MLKIIFIGCIEFSHATFKQLITLPHCKIIGVITKASSTFHADFRSLAPLAQEFNIPCYIFRKEHELEMLKWIKKLAPDYIFCFGWSHLLSPAILSAPKYYTIGYHPTELPRNRGRCPLIWTLALGLPHTASTFFVITPQPDAGHILSQRKISIAPTDNAQKLYNKVIKVACSQLTQLVNDLANQHVKKKIQHHRHANSWRKRTHIDGKIDWRMSSSSIYNLVRALSKPYPGAYCYYNNQEVRIWEVRILPERSYRVYRNIEPGKVIKIYKKDLYIKCGDGGIRILKHEFSSLPLVGEYL